MSRQDDQGRRRQRKPAEKPQAEEQYRLSRGPDGSATTTSILDEEDVEHSTHAILRQELKAIALYNAQH